MVCVGVWWWCVVWRGVVWCEAARLRRHGARRRQPRRIYRRRRQWCVLVCGGGVWCGVVWCGVRRRVFVGMARAAVNREGYIGADANGVCWCVVVVCGVAWCGVV